MAEPAKQGQVVEERPEAEDAPDESGGPDAQVVRKAQATDDGPAALSRGEAPSARQPRPTARRSGPVIERRPGFYQSIWAKLLTAVFVVVAGALIVAWLAGLLSPTGMFRLLIVVIPGVIYMVWRTFGRRRG
jgi:hypothetical protein